MRISRPNNAHCRKPSPRAHPMRNHYSWVQGTNLCRVYNYHDSQACDYKRSGILFWLDGLDGMGEIGQVFVKALWLLRAYVTIPYDMLKLNLMGSFSLQL
jgi:hypothetical protein